MKIDHCHEKIKILYVYHPDRMEEKVLCQMLEQSTYQVYLASQKQQALDAVQHETIDIALVSVHIPFMDPYILCHQINTKQKFTPTLLVVSSAESVDIPKALAQGVSDLIISPYIKQLIFARINNYIRLFKLESLLKSKSRARGVESATHKQSPLPMVKDAQTHKQYQFKDTRILLAEDNEVNQQLMNNILAQSGIDVDISNDGQGAVDKIRNVLKNNQPMYDLILMDLQMPVMDGFAASHAINELLEQENKPDIPIVAITAHTSVHSREKCLRTGMVDFLAKPIDPEACLDMVSQWIHSEKIEQAKKDSLCLEKSVSFSTNIQIPEINFKIGLKRAAGNESLLKKMLLEFYSSYQHTGGQLQQFNKEGKYEDLRVMTHTLKGLGGNIGAENLHQNALLLEQAIKKNSSEDIDISINKLVETIDRLMNGIKQNLDWLEEKQLAQQSSNKGREKDQSLKSAFDNLYTILDQGRTSATDYFRELADQIPESMKADAKRLESLIESYDYEKAQLLVKRLQKEALCQY